MRKYDTIIEDYLNWYVVKTSQTGYLPKNYLSGDSEEINIKKAAIWQQILELCYQPIDGIYWFAKFILGDLLYAGYPEPIRFNSLWRKWSKLVTEGDHIAIKCPRQHGKSTFWTVIQSIYRTTMFKNYNILIESASEDQAMMLMNYIVNIIVNNEFLIEKRNKGAKWSTTEIEFNNGVIRAKGVGAEVRGGTYDYIVCDDILRSDNKLGDEEIETFIGEELEAMILVRHGQIVLVGTPKSETDIFTTISDRIIDKEKSEIGWKLFEYQAILDWENKILLCPDRFTWDQLMAKRAIMGTMKFDKEFMCKTYSSGSQLFPYEIRKKAMELGTRYILYSRARTSEEALWRYYMGVDCARAGTAGGDYTVVFVIAYNIQTQEKRIVWMWRKKGLKISEQVKQIAQISKDFNNPVILVEQNNIGQDFIDEMVDHYNLNVEAFTTGSKGHGKEDLIRYLITSFEHEKLIMPMGNELSRRDMKLLDRELERFVVEITRAGNEQFKGSGHSHDDMVIALALANRCSQSFGYSPFATSIPSTHTSELERYAASNNLDDIFKIENQRW